MTDTTPNTHTSDEAPAARSGHERTWRRYVAIGDSFTEGMSDHDPREDDAYLGWADRLAVDIAMQQEERGAKLEYANLAVRGRLLADVIGPQLDAALAMKPDLVSMVGGGNDIMRPSVNLDDLAAGIRRNVIAALERMTGLEVVEVNITVHDVYVADDTVDRDVDAKRISDELRVV